MGGPAGADVVADSLKALHAIVADAKAPATARERAARTLLEAQGVVGRRPGEGPSRESARPAVAPADEGPSPFAGYSDERLRAVGEQLKALHERLERIRHADGDVSAELAAVAAEMEALRAG